MASIVKNKILFFLESSKLNFLLNTKITNTYTSTSLKSKIIAGDFSVRKSFYFNFLGIFAWLYGKILRIKVLPSSEMSFFNKLVPLGKVLDKIVFNKIGLSAIVVAKKQSSKSA